MNPPHLGNRWQILWSGMLKIEHDWMGTFGVMCISFYYFLKQHESIEQHSSMVHH